MILRLRLKYKYMCVVTVFIVIFLLIVLSKSIYLNECNLNEPIDVVYTWVNGTDPLFVKELKSYSIYLPPRKVDKSKARYFDRYELKFSLRSLEKFAPWIRNVYIVTNGQIPYWLNLDYENVFLISHDEIFVNQNDLPSFSSPSIETHLHRIPGLSKKFLYFNDDIYLGAPIYLDDFYSEGHGYFVYLDYPMQSCADGCPWIYVHDGQCDKECNITNCQMDGGDCDGNATVSYGLQTTPYLAPLNVTYLNRIEIESTTRSSQSGETIAKNGTNLKRMFAKLAPSLEDSSVKRLVDSHNRNKITEDKMKRKKISKPKAKSKKPIYFDAYRESLQHTNRLFNSKYGFTPRYVPAHMPFLIDVDVMTELQATFPQEFATTSANRIRRVNDVQFAFSYFHFLMEEKVDVSIEEIFSKFDTDLSGTWSDREIRTVLTQMHTIPLSSLNIDEFDSLLVNCSKSVQPKPVTTPEYERYIDSVLPTISEELVTQCEDLKIFLHSKFKTKPKYTYDIIKDVKKYVTFEMIQSNVQSTVVKLDKIRKKPTKFVCLNDNIYYARNESTINAIWYDFYVSLFPVPSKFELPCEYRNRFQYIKDLRWYQTKMTFYLYGCVLVFTYVVIYLVCKNNTRT